MASERKRPTAVVIGAGWAGLSAAVELAERGFSVTVLEQSKRLGGRASSFIEAKTGDVIDNGQHLLMGCYQRTFEFLRKIGAAERVKFQDNLAVDFARPHGQLSTLQCRPWPAPFHLISGLWNLDLIPWNDKLAMGRVYLAVKKGPTFKTRGITVDEWLMGLGQSERARRYFWDPITLAALNEQPAVAEASALAIVLNQAFFSSRENSRIAVPCVGLSELCEPAVAFIQDRGGSVRNNQLVARVELGEGSAVHGVRLRDGQRIEADVYISAVPFFSLANLLDAAVAQGPFFSKAQPLESSPIFSITLWFDRPVTDRAFVALLDTEVQWLFNRRRITGADRKVYDADSAPSARDPGHVTCVISGARKFLDWPNDRLLSVCLEELRSCFPQSRHARLVHSLIQREKNATLSPAVAYERARLPQKTPFRNFFLCGDWTDTGLPATIESAVLSGCKAAEVAAKSVRF